MYSKSEQLCAIPPPLHPRRGARAGERRRRVTGVNFNRDERCDLVVVENFKWHIWNQHGQKHGINYRNHKILISHFFLTPLMTLPRCCTLLFLSSIHPSSSFPTSTADLHSYLFHSFSFLSNGGFLS